MATSKIIVAAMVAVVGVTALSGAALGQPGTGRTPSQSDFDLCNREAQIARGSSSPSASPGVPASPGITSPGVSTSPGGGAASGGGASVSGSATGSVSGGAASGTTSAAGATGGTGSVSGGSTLSSGPSATADTQLRGLSSSAGSDPVVQQAYRDCMRRRGF
jgi:hypothetical protein